MNELSFGQILVIVGEIFLGLAVTIFAVRVGISLNLVEYFKFRRETQRKRLQNICPHATVVKIPGTDDFGIESYFHSPYLSTEYVCSRCQMVVSSRDHVHRLQEIWKGDPIALMEREERFDKEIAKYYKI